MADKFEMNELLDFYGQLLSEKQKRICEYYYREDYSLQEIADIEGVSRSAVYDTVRRCDRDLADYESRLHCVSSWKKRMKLYEMIRKRTDDEIGVLLDQCIETETE